MNRVIKICGLDCANCARELEEEIQKVSGVNSVSVDFMGQKVHIDCGEEVLEKVKDLCNNFEEVKVVEDAPEQRADGETLRIQGLCCANCGRELEEELNKIQDVTATVDFINSKIVLNAKTQEAREKAVYAITHFEDVKIVDGRPKSRGVLKSHLKELITIAVSLVLFIPAFVFDLTHLTDIFAVRIATYVLFGLAYIIVGYKVLYLTAKNIVKGKVFDENFLMTVASVGAIALGIFAGEGFAEGVAVMLLYNIGELLQSIAVGSSRNSITELLDLKSESATLLENGVQRTISPDELKIGDTILIKAGEKVPVDCRVVKGESSLDMKSLNGEPLPRDVKEGEEILSGSINLSGVIEAVVLREYKNSAVAKILELVENSTAKKSKSERFITRFAHWYTPLVCLASLIVAIVVPTVICAVQSAFVWAVYAEWIYKALGFLVISCPCALVISVPLSYFGGIGRCAKFGILVKGSTCLDELASATQVAFDKTGTITEGKFGIKSYTDERTLALAVAAEKFSSHPVALAFGGLPTEYVADNAEEIAGKGVKCTVNGEVLLCGNSALLNDNGVKFETVNSTSTLVYVALNGSYVGVIGIDDTVKQDAKQAVAELKAQGIENTVMLTGDLSARAEAVANEAGLDGYRAELLPDEKLACAEELKKQGKLIYAGDGINDVPVMTSADCAVSMGKMGSDVAIEASDIVLVSDKLSLLPKGRRIAKGTKRIVIQNIAGSLLIKAVIMALDIAIPSFPLIVSVVADVGVMLLAVLNSLRTNLLK